VDNLPYAFSFIYVNDGSSDATADDLLAVANSDKRVRVISLSRNFGHQAALTAGLDASSGEAVVSLDADGQHPPELIPQMLDLIAQGYDIVQGQRTDDAQLSRFKKWTSGLFYSVLNVISGTRVLPGAADFRAMSRRAVDALKSMPEYHRFLRGMVSWIGFKSAILPYHQEKRAGGISKYSFGKMVRLASDAVFSFSLMPLYIGLSAGMGFIVLALAQMAWVAFLWLTGQTDRVVPGWSSLMAVLLIASGIIMIVLGFIGVYVGYIFQEVKRRPIYLVKDEHGGEN
jgi:dolichol-phosphate mannosyltransferase